ncbi:MAG: DUF2156 domain-containing protein [Oscillospiraceae bacterium]|nr:DUF2156 domain-containing protein [Oscillospiraceae bacterium]
MDRGQTKSARIFIEDIVIVCIGLLSAAMLAASFFPYARFSGLLLHMLEIKEMTARMFSAVLLILLYSLYRRNHAAWCVAEALLAINIVRHLLFPETPAFLGVAAAEALCFLLLIYFGKDFRFPSERRSLRRSITMLALAAAGILLNSGISYHLTRIQMPETPHSVMLWDSLRDVCGILVGVYAGSAPETPLGRFETYVFWFSWICLLLALLYALRPWIARFFWTKDDMRRARALVLAYGQNPASYLTLEDDKLLYFSKKVRGVLPYGVVGSTVVVNGDPICPPEDFPAFLAEFSDFCRSNDHKLIFLSITGRFLDEYKKQGFGVVKCGEEARFDLSGYDISGKKGAKMRMNVNHATRAGVTVHEYRPTERRDAGIEAAMERITREWLADKKSGMLSFTMGTIGLDDPMDRRYFYALDAAGGVCGFNVYCPYDGGAGYMADITRRASDAPSGVTEKIMYEAFLTFRQEGVRSVSLGVAPLANILPSDGQRPNGAERVLNFVYEHLNACYGFKDLYRAKRNYNPTEWVPGYYAWLPRISTPSMFYAVVRIQNPRGLSEFVLSLLKARKSGDR